MTEKMPKVVLASGSVYRKMLLERLFLKFDIEVPGINETPDPSESPVQWAERLAARKAQSVSMKHPEALVIGSDQVADFNGNIIGKPASEEDAVAQLMSFSGHTVAFHSGIALIGMAAGVSSSAVETVKVHFRELNEDEVKHYINVEKPLDCVGSFKCESLGVSLFSRIDGRDHTALIGMPLIRLCSMLRKAGVDLPLAATA